MKYRTYRHGTKPVRYGIIESDRIIAEGLTRATAQRIIAALSQADNEPTIHQAFLKKVKDAGV